MVLQCSKLIYSKVFSGFLRRDAQSSYSFGKIRNVGDPELSEEKKISASLEKDFIFLFHIYFSASFVFIYIHMLFKEKTINILIRLFRLLLLSIHVNIYNLSIVHKII